MTSRFVFAGRTVVVTGAASGIGRALALELASRGSQLALIDRDARGLRRVAHTLQAHADLRISTHTFDLSRLQDIPQLVQEVEGAHGEVHVLINNAGVALGGTFEQLTLEEFEWLMTINFRAVVALCKHFLPLLQRQKGSHIVNMSSLFGLVGPPGQSAYCASKFAVRGFSEVLRQELAPCGIHVTTVHPGGVKTNIARHARVAAAASEADAARGHQTMERLLRLDPAVAAHLIARAIEHRQPRLLIGRDARLLDLLSRLLPAHHWSLLAPFLKGR